jgi:hypothetical protein
MILRYLSDLYLEFIRPHKIEKFIRYVPNTLSQVIMNITIKQKILKKLMII